MEYRLLTLPLKEVLVDFPRESLLENSIGGDEGKGRGRQYQEVWVVTKVEERWWLRADVEEEEEEEEGVEGRWLGWCCQNMLQVGGRDDVYRWTSKEKTIVNSMHHTTLKYDVS